MTLYDFQKELQHRDWWGLGFQALWLQVETTDDVRYEDIRDVISTFKKQALWFKMNDSTHKWKFPNSDYICRLHTMGSEPATSLFLDRWPTHCTTKAKVASCHISANVSQWDVQKLFVYLHLKCCQQSNFWRDLQWIVAFLIIQIWLRHWLSSHDTLLRLPLSVTRTPQVAAIIASEQFAVVVGVFFVFFLGLIATIKSLQNDNNLTVWDKIMDGIT